MAVSFVAAGTPYTETGGGGTSFTLNAPAGIATGDLMVAQVAFWANGSQKTVTVSGWTVLQTAYKDTGSGDQFQHVVLTRTATASEPASWSGTASGTVYLKAANVCAYRGVQTMGASGATTISGGTSLSTATVNNTLANSWRIVFGAYFSGSSSSTIASNETTRRVLGTSEDTVNGGATQMATWDSNTTVLATGNTSRTVSRSSAWVIGTSVILLVQPSTGTPASGTWASTLGNVSWTDDGNATVHDDATVSSTLGNVSFLGSGYGTPPVVTGPMASTLGNVSCSVSAATDVTGSLATVVLPAVNIIGETRAFGVRVINVELDDRTIAVQSRGVDD